MILLCLIIIFGVFPIALLWSILCVGARSDRRLK